MGSAKPGERSSAGHLIPTAAQVNLALAVLGLGAPSDAQRATVGSARGEAGALVRLALCEPGWDGSTAECPPFGFESVNPQRGEANETRNLAKILESAVTALENYELAITCGGKAGNMYTQHIIKEARAALAALSRE